MSLLNANLWIYCKEEDIGSLESVSERYLYFKRTHAKIRFYISSSSMRTSSSARPSSFIIPSSFISSPSTSFSSILFWVNADPCADIRTHFSLDSKQNLHSMFPCLGLDCFDHVYLRPYEVDFLPYIDCIVQYIPLRCAATWPYGMKNAKDICCTAVEDIYSVYEWG